MNKSYKKGSIVFVNTAMYPPWPSQVDRRLSNGLYRVNFYGEKSYTTIELQKMDLFTEARAKQLIQELNNKQLNRAISIATKDLESKKKKKEYDPQLLKALDMNLPPLDLSAYTEVGPLKGQGSSQNFSNSAGNQNISNQQKQDAFLQPVSKKIYSFSNNNQHKDAIVEISRILDGVYEFMISPASDKVTPEISKEEFEMKKRYFQEETEKFRELMWPNNSFNSQNLSVSLINDTLEEPPGNQSKPYKRISQPSLQKSASFTVDMVDHTKPNFKAPNRSIEKAARLAAEKDSMQTTSYPPNASQRRENGIKFQKIVEEKILQKIIMTIKAYEAFSDESQPFVENLIDLARKKFNEYYQLFKRQLENKKTHTHKDRVLLKKFENFEAYG